MVIRSVEQGVYLCASQAPGLHPNHRLGHPGPAGQQGAQDVGLVASGNGYQEVSVINSRSLEDVHVSSAARDSQEIRLLPNLKKALRGLLNEGHLMALPVQTFSNVGAGLAGTHHDDAHSTNPSLWTSGAGGMPLLRRTNRRQPAHLPGRTRPTSVTTRSRGTSHDRASSRGTTWKAWHRPISSGRARSAPRTCANVRS